MLLKTDPHCAANSIKDTTWCGERGFTLPLIHVSQTVFVLSAARR
ncbi:hypothetical protein LTSEGIV_5811 [Salmonella enterica subsp. enterica serovar Give str. S5-487]|nr:hypothetical protein LTSEGIV_5811 [Salmonella enterica subsp. enterica serovar Give str. S5-487]